jgi:phosphate transport system protein
MFMAMSEGRHWLPGFDTALDTLRADMLMMGNLVRRNVSNAKQGFRTRDDDYCAAVIADDDEIDILEKQVDRTGTDILVRFQPMTFDLRRVLATIKVGTHLERLSNQMVNIARRVRKLNEEPPLEEAIWLDAIFDPAEIFLGEALDAFVSVDSPLAEQVRSRIEPLAQHARDLDDRYTCIVEERTPFVRGYVSLIAIAQCLERTAYIIENIAEEAIYVAEAKDVRHEGNPLEEV